MLKNLQNIKTIKAIGILLIIGLVLTIYLPSLNHMPRSDQWAFLVDTLEYHTVVDTFKNSYSYNRTRVMAPGDSTLFRPLLFLILSLEKGIFGNHFRYIQAIGIFLHIIVVLLLFIIMNQLRDILKIKETYKQDITFTLLGILFIAFYALNFSFAEIVIWSHLHAYMVFQIFTLLSFILLLKYITMPNDKQMHKWIIILSVWTLTLLGAFIFEFEQIIAILTGIFLFILLKSEGLKKALLTSLLFMLIPIIYQSANVIDMHMRSGDFTSDVTISMILKLAFYFSTVEHAVRLFGYFVIHPFFPTLAEISYTTRTVINELNWNKIGPFIIPSFLVFIAWTLFMIFGIAGWMKKNLSKLNVLFFLILSIYLGYFSLILFGRVNMRPNFEVISTSTYYLYFPLCLLTIFTLILTGSAVTNNKFANNQYVTLSKQTLFLVMPLVIFFSMLKINTINSNYTQKWAPHRHAINKIQTFVEQNPNMKLSFSIDHSEGLSGAYGIPLTTILFRRFEDNRNPDYVVTLSPGEAKFIPTSEYRKKYKLQDGQDIAPTLVKIGLPYHIYVYNGKRIGIPHQQFQTTNN